MESVFLIFGALIAIAIWLYYANSTRAVPTKSETDSPSPVDITYAMLQVAETLKNAYSRLLQMKGQGMLRPASMLPASKEKIKAALVLVALYHKAKGKLDKAGFEMIQKCYGHLADFVSDDVAEKSRKWCELTLDPETLKRGQENPIWLSREISKGAYPIEEMNTSNQVFAHLCDEFEHRLNALDDPAGKSQEFAVIRKVLLGE
jgi:hypothetical protein